MREDYDDIVLPFIEQHRDAFPDPAATSFDAFCRAASWVASRAFCVDHWHGVTPLAHCSNALHVHSLGHTVCAVAVCAVAMCAVAHMPTVQ